MLNDIWMLHQLIFCVHHSNAPIKKIHLPSPLSKSGETFLSKWPRVGYALPQSLDPSNVLVHFHSALILGLYHVNANLMTVTEMEKTCQPYLGTRPQDHGDQCALETLHTLEWNPGSKQTENRRKMYIRTATTIDKKHTSEQVQRNLFTVFSVCVRLELGWIGCHS